MSEELKAAIAGAVLPAKMRRENPALWSVGDVVAPEVIAVIAAVASLAMTRRTPDAAKAEPVAWRYRPKAAAPNGTWAMTDDGHAAAKWDCAYWEIQPLYPQPPQPSPGVGEAVERLTNDARMLIENYADGDDRKRLGRDIAAVLAAPARVEAEDRADYAEAQLHEAEARIATLEAERKADGEAMNTALLIAEVDASLQGAHPMREASIERLRPPEGRRVDGRPV